jgi:hypothetical protein
VRPGGDALRVSTSARDKPVGAIFTLNKSCARERQMSRDKPPFGGSEPVEEAWRALNESPGLS